MAIGFLIEIHLSTWLYRHFCIGIKSFYVDTNFGSSPFVFFILPMKFQSVPYLSTFPFLLVSLTRKRTKGLRRRWKKLKPFQFHAKKSPKSFSLLFLFFFKQNSLATAWCLPGHVSRKKNLKKQSQFWGATDIKISLEMFSNPASVFINPVSRL